MRLWNFITGYVMIRVEGISLEKFLNLAQSHRVSIAAAKRISYTVLSAVVSAKGLKKLRNIAAEKYNIKVVKQAGIPYRFSRLAARKVFFVGILAVAVLAFAASMFVWEVRISGLEYNETESLKKELFDFGIHSGSLKTKLDLKETEKRLMLNHPEFAWINIKLRGVVADVEVVPAIPAPKIVDDTKPCSIVAAKDALIESVTAKTGRACVKAGDTVREGDVLISGVVWDPGMPRMLFAARGEVIAKVWYAGTASAPLYRSRQNATGRVQIKRVIEIGADRAAIDGDCTFPQYQTSDVGMYYIVGLFLPIRLITVKHTEIKTELVPVDLQNLRVYLEERAFYIAAGKTSADVVSHVTVFKQNENVLSATVYVQTYEDIGRVNYLEE